MSSVVLAVVLAGTLCASEFTPPRFLQGEVPLPPVQTVGWNEAWLQVLLTPAGRVDKIETLRANEPLATLLSRAVESWTFEPARDDENAVASQVLVAAVYRPPVRFNIPTIGTPASHVGSASDEIPFPTSTSPPAYPPNAQFDGVVLVEVRVGPNGEVLAAGVVRSSASGFDDAAIRAAERWQFRPARRNKVAVEARAYLVFGFRQPVISRSVVVTGDGTIHAAEETGIFAFRPDGTLRWKFPVDFFPVGVFRSQLAPGPGAPLWFVNQTIVFTLASGG